VVGAVLSSSREDTPAGFHDHFIFQILLMARKKARPEREGRANYPVSPEEFALTWNGSASAQEAADELGMPLPIVLARVSNYRKKGIRMKKMPRKNGRRVDVEGINKKLETANSFFCQTSSELVERVFVLANQTGGTHPPRGLSVRIHLLDGTADGLRVFERLHSTLRAITCSKARFLQAKARPEFQKPGVYVLVGPPESNGLPRIYVGEADPALPRLEQHLAKKQFWDSLVLFTSKDDGLHKAHIQYLEARLTALARDARRCQLDNGNHPQPPSLSEADVVEAEGFLSELLLLCPFVGRPYFDP
jgi:hypothetical protein